MKRARWAFSEWLCIAWQALFIAAAVAGAAPAAAVVVAPTSVAIQVSPAADPAALSSDWTVISPPDPAAASRPPPEWGMAWYRVAFELPAVQPGTGSWSLYLPYLYRGGRFWINDVPLATIAQNTPQTHVRWDRPHLLTVPDSQLHPGRNELLVHALATDPGAGARLRQMAIGPREELQSRYDSRLFWVHSLPQGTVVACLVTGLFVGFIWWRRRSEVLYGLFGLAALLWGVRTLTFVIEVMPTAWWPWWRTVYHAATGGFVVVLALFAMRFAGLRWPWLDRALFGYWLIGPLAMLASGGRLDAQMGFYWTAGLIPVGLSIVGFTAFAAWSQRTGEAVALFVAVSLATAAGLHDYLVTYNGAAPAPAIFADWAAQRIYLLHHGADLVLLCMVGILTLRFVQALDSTEDLNRHLEARVAARERELQARHAELSRLTQDRAAADERQRIMQDLHDGLGSQLFVALSHVERGAIDAPGVGRLLRDCIADMRLTFEVVVPDDADPRAVLGSFRFRWEALLREAGLASDWSIEVTPDAVALPPAAALQILRVAQEALTNVLKHAAATRVRVVMQHGRIEFLLAIEDNGRGGAEGASGGPGRGLANMRRRSLALGASLDIDSRPGLTRVALHVPLQRHG